MLVKCRTAHQATIIYQWYPQTVFGYKLVDVKLCDKLEHVIICYNPCKWIHIYIYTYTYAYTYIHIHIYIYMYHGFIPPFLSTDLSQPADFASKFCCGEVAALSWTPCCRGYTWRKISRINQANVRISLAKHRISPGKHRIFHVDYGFNGFQQTWGLRQQNMDSSNENSDFAQENGIWMNLTDLTSKNVRMPPAKIGCQHRVRWLKTVWRSFKCIPPLQVKVHRGSPDFPSKGLPDILDMAQKSLWQSNSNEILRPRSYLKPEPPRVRVFVGSELAMKPASDLNHPISSIKGAAYLGVEQLNLLLVQLRSLSAVIRSIGLKLWNPWMVIPWTHGGVQLVIGVPP